MFNGSETMRCTFTPRAYVNISEQFESEKCSHLCENHHYSLLTTVTKLKRTDRHVSPQNLQFTIPYQFHNRCAILLRCDPLDDKNILNYKVNISAI